MYFMYEVQVKIAEKASLPREIRLKSRVVMLVLPLLCACIVTKDRFSPLYPNFQAGEQKCAGWMEIRRKPLPGSSACNWLSTQGCRTHLGADVEISEKGLKGISVKRAAISINYS